MDAIGGLNHWLDQIDLMLEPKQRRELMRRLAQGLRVRFRDRIKQQRDPDGNRFIPRKRDQTGKIKRNATLFQKIGKQLKTEYSDNHAVVGFGGRTGFVASVHQEGKTIRPSKNAKPTRYPIRQVVGFSKDDEQWIKSEIQKFLTI
ncbi:phage virion morphogenesis protein [Acinetobacter sp. NIPH 1852]|uniref:phage virion morphogenesis protein n=1 Tax=Acinetobacter sp. NIPH 1852 TaxID=2923428 RepID=UPI001F4B64F8|nr:phage virion morphogenesis protein [Acinetobacter sp. NIPH 1852]MCH7306615.1 phage virion morphogenesis protein [Acinetobacter sp. NIPH 1852]